MDMAESDTGEFSEQTLADFLREQGVEEADEDEYAERAGQTTSSVRVAPPDDE